MPISLRLDSSHSSQDLEKFREEACGWNRCAWAYADEHAAAGLSTEVKKYVEEMNCPPPWHKGHDPCWWFQEFDQENNVCTMPPKKVSGTVSATSESYVAYERPVVHIPVM